MQVPVVAIVNSGRSKVEKVMHLMRCLLAIWEVSLVCSHIPGILNGAADALSRDALSSFQRLMPRFPPSYQTAWWTAWSEGHQTGQTWIGSACSLLLHERDG